MRFLFTLIICGSLYGQNHSTKIGTWVDPTFTDGGFQLGIELTKEFDNIGWVSVGTSHYADLNPPYTDLVTSGGIMSYLLNHKQYYGARIGVEYRRGQPYPMVGFVVGNEFDLDRLLSIGFRVWRDYRASQDKQFYGGSDSNKWRNNGALTLIFKL